LKIAYLDQKGWIDLAKCGEEITGAIVKAVKAGSAIFPLSIIHVAETWKISNSKRREKLASLMVMLSKGYSFLPNVDSIIEMEIRQTVRFRYGLASTDVGKYVFGKGIGHLVEAVPKIVSRRGTPELPDQIKQELLDLLDSPEALYTILTGQHKIPRSIQAYDVEATKAMEHIRKERSEIKDNKLRRRVEFARFFRDMIVPKLAKVLFEMNLPKDPIITAGWSEKDFREFLNSIPTALCLFTLTLERDQQLQRPIPLNDIYDIWALSLAIPYSNIVVTENMWSSISRQSRLDVLCNTIIVSTIDELLEHL